MSDCTFIHRQVHTRKPHRCIFCWAPIPIGELCWYWTGVYDGEFQSSHGHAECQSSFEDDGCEEFTPGDYPVPDRIRTLYTAVAQASC